MHIKEYIESGILEAYVLDALTPEEKQEVMQHIAQHPELAEEAKAIEESMLAFARAGAEDPPEFLKEKIWDAIVQGPTHIALPSPIVSPGRSENIRPLQTAKPSWQRAAVWAAVMVSILTNLILLSQKNKMQEAQAVLQQTVDSLRTQHQYLSGVAAAYNKEKEMLADTSVQTVVMKSIRPGHTMAATVYWNKQKSETYVAIQKLPPPPAGSQYQLWAMQDDKPVSMGIIPDEVVIQGGMMKIDMPVAGGQTFAISLEKAGGSSAPTMKQIQVLGRAS